MRRQYAAPTDHHHYCGRQRDNETPASMGNLSNVIVACLIVASFFAYFYFSYGVKNYWHFFIESFAKVTGIDHGID